MLVMGYYPDWLSSSLLPARIDFQRFDWIDFAFAVPSANATLSWDDPSAPGLLDKLVFAAHSQGSKVKLSIGGWTGSKWVVQYPFNFIGPNQHYLLPDIFQPSWPLIIAEKLS